MNERWARYDEKFFVSDQGGVYSVARQVRTKNKLGNWTTRQTRGRMLKGWVVRGYRWVSLSPGENMLVHRMVAYCFCPNPDCKPHVNHIDGNPLNNSASNLEWCTHEENMRHARDTGLIEQKIKIRCVDTGEIFESLKHAAESRGKSAGNLCSTLKGKQKTWDGHRWEYVDPALCGLDGAYL